MIPNKKGKLRLVETFQLSHAIDEQQLKKEQRLHGITCFITNLDQESSSAVDIIQWYRRKNKVEEVFHEIKSHIHLRPIYLSRAQRVKAHVTICILAYFLYNDLEYRLRESNIAMSPDELLRLLKECQVNRLEFKKSHQVKLSITEPSAKQKEILHAIGCESVIDPNHVKQALKKAENWL